MRNAIIKFEDLKCAIKIGYKESKRGNRLVTIKELVEANKTIGCMKHCYENRIPKLKMFRSFYHNKSEKQRNLIHTINQTYT